MLAANLKAILDRTPAERILVIVQWPDGTRASLQAFDLQSCETIQCTNHRGESTPMLALVVGNQVDVLQARGAN